MRSETLDATAADGRVLRVEFVWRGDRFGHVLSMGDDVGPFIPLMESVEGDAGDASPPSPPLQSLSLETLPDGRRVALLVGMAGRGHWSASIEPVAGAAAIDFDLACRIAGSGGALASNYRLTASGDTSLFSAADRSWIECQQESGAAIAVSIKKPVESTSLEVLSDSTFAVVALNRPSAATARWCYRCEYVKPDSGLPISALSSPHRRTRHSGGGPLLDRG
jgi:hypothetical protein